MTERGPEVFRRAAPDGVEVALHRLDGARGRGSHPVLMVPGTFTPASFWLGPQGAGFGRALAEAGFDPWVLEPRGHGESERPRSWSMHDWIRHDAPTAVRAVLEESDAPGLFWVGHSAGGVVGAALSAAEPALRHRLLGLVLLGAPGPGTLVGARRWAGRIAYWATVGLPGLALPGRALGLGPESESARLVSQWMSWNLGGAWRDPEGRDYLAALPQVEVPLLAVAGAGDRWIAPPHAVGDLVRRFGSRDRTLLVAGRETGFGLDYGHAGLLMGRQAREEIWPRVIDWLHARSPEPREQR